MTTVESFVTHLACFSHTNHQLPVINVVFPTYISPIIYGTTWNSIWFILVACFNNFQSWKLQACMLYDNVYMKLETKTLDSVQSSRGFFLEIVKKIDFFVCLCDNFL